MEETHKRMRASAGDCSMKTYSCPSCGAQIALRDINVKSDLMLCRACGKTTSCPRYRLCSAFKILNLGADIDEDS